MHRYSILFLLSGIVLLSACVPNRKIIYLQKKGGSENDSQPHDTVVRNYELEKFDYKIQTNDVVYIRYQSLTQEEFDYSQQQPQTSGGGGGNSMGGAGVLMRG